LHIIAALSPLLPQENLQQRHNRNGAIAARISSGLEVLNSSMGGEARSACSCRVQFCYTPIAKFTAGWI
jgi:hypothetical protein